MNLSGMKFIFRMMKVIFRKEMKIGWVPDHRRPSMLDRIYGKKFIKAFSNHKLDRQGLQAFHVNTLVTGRFTRALKLNHGSCLLRNGWSGHESLWCLGAGMAMPRIRLLIAKEFGMG
jgi:hypothetical protein